MRFSTYVEAFESNRRDFLRGISHAMTFRRSLPEILEKLSKENVPLNVDLQLYDDEARFLGIGWIKRKTEQMFGLLRDLGIRNPVAGVEQFSDGNGFDIRGTITPNQALEFAKKNSDRVTNVTNQLFERLEKDVTELERIKKLGPTRYYHEYLKRMSFSYGSDVKRNLNAPGAREHAEQHWLGDVKSLEKQISQLNDYLSTNPVNLKIRLSESMSVNIFDKPLDRLHSQILRQELKNQTPINDFKDLGKFAFDSMEGHLDPSKWMSLSPEEQDFLRQVTPEDVEKTEKWSDLVRQQEEREQAELQAKERIKQEFRAKAKRDRENEPFKRIQGNRDSYYDQLRRERSGIRGFDQTARFGGMHQSYDDVADPIDPWSFKQFLKSSKTG